VTAEEQHVWHVNVAQRHLVDRRQPAAAAWQHGVAIVACGNSGWMDYSAGSVCPLWPSAAGRTYSTGMPWDLQQQ